MYLDQGYDVCKKMLTIIANTEIMYSTILYKDTNYKDRLQHFYHANNWTHPVYTCIGVETTAKNQKLYTMGVYGNNKEILTQACDTSKKKAEQKCCKLALYKFNQLNQDEVDDLLNSTN